MGNFSANLCQRDRHGPINSTVLRRQIRFKTNNPGRLLAHLIGKLGAPKMKKISLIILLASVQGLAATTQMTLVIAGSSAINAGTCSSFTLSRLSTSTQAPSPVGSSVVRTFPLSGNGHGQFYSPSDSTCSGSAITQVTLSGAYQTNFHFKDSTAESLTLAANTIASNQGTYTPGLKSVTISSTGQSIPASLFGMHFYFGINLTNPAPISYPTVPVGAQAKPAEMGWLYVESQKGVFNWANLDNWVATAKAHNTDVMYSFVRFPKWATVDVSTCTYANATGIDGCTGAPNLTDLTAFVTALVTRYKGKIQYYELYNEPYVKGEYSGSVADMVALTKVEHDVIRALDPAAKIISPTMYGYDATGFMSNATTGYWALGGTQDVDVIGQHTYPDTNNDIAETTTNLTNDIKTILKAYPALAKKPIWTTEGSWGDAAEGAITDPNLRAAFIARDYLLHWSNGVSRFYWYAWDEQSWGTLHVTGATSPSAAEVAYTQVYDWMVGAVMPTPCTFTGSTNYLAIYTCELTRASGYQALAVWNTVESSTTATTSYAVPSNYLHYRDLTGAVTAVPANHVIQIGLKPILLENK